MDEPVVTFCVVYRKLVLKIQKRLNFWGRVKFITEAFKKFWRGIIVTLVIGFHLKMGPIE